MMEESSFRGCGEMEAEAQLEDTGLKSMIGKGVKCGVYYSCWVAKLG